MQSMNVEIFRPLGIYLITGGENPQRLSVLSMTAGRIMTSLEKSREIEDDSLNIVAIEIHGEEMAFHLPVKKAEGGRGMIEWDNWSLSLTIYSRWITGLSLDQKEAMIGEVLRFEEGVEKAIHIEKEEESYALKKLKAS